MAQQAPPPAWLPWFGILMSIGGVIYIAGGVSGDVKRNTDRITALEASDRARSDGLAAIDRRTTRMEAKIDYLLPPDRRRSDSTQDGGQ